MQANNKSMSIALVRLQHRARGRLRAHGAGSARGSPSTGRRQLSAGSRYVASSTSSATSDGRLLEGGLFAAVESCARIGLQMSCLNSAKNR